MLFRYVITRSLTFKTTAKGSHLSCMLKHPMLSENKLMQFLTMDKQSTNTTSFLKNSAYNVFSSPADHNIEAYSLSGTCCLACELGLCHSVL